MRDAWRVFAEIRDRHRVDPASSSVVIVSRFVRVPPERRRWEFCTQGAAASWGARWTISICISPITPADSSPSPFLPADSAFHGLRAA